MLQILANAKIKKINNKNHWYLSSSLEKLNIITKTILVINNIISGIEVVFFNISLCPKIKLKHSKHIIVKILSKINQKPLRHSKVLSINDFFFSKSQEKTERNKPII